MSDSPKPLDSSRRTAIGLTCAVGAVGTVAVAIPFVSSMAPSERAKAAGAPVEVDIAGMKPGDLKRVEWRGKPVWVVRRTPEMLETLKKSEEKVADPGSLRTAYPTPDYAKNQYRSIKPEYLVVVGICSHLGCSPIDKFEGGGDPSLPADWAGRLPVPVPRLDLRPGRPRVQEQAGARQPRSAAARLSVRHAPADRRRQEGLIGRNAESSAGFVVTRGSRINPSLVKPRGEH